MERTKGGHDLPFPTRFRIYQMAKDGVSAWKIHKELNISYDSVSRWSNPQRIKEIEETGSFQSKRGGHVGRKETYDSKERLKLIERLEKPNMTQKKLAEEEGVDRKTILRATRFDHESKDYMKYIQNSSLIEATLVVVFLTPREMHPM